MKGRFAPTPSGRMHLGNIFSFLLCWLSAKSQGGTIVLRIEDLDLSRTSPDYTRQLMKDLLWLGLYWDEGPGAGAQREDDLPQNAECPAAHPLYFQSRRTAFYESQLAKLDALGLLYPCFCSRAELHAANAPHASDGNYIYPRRCLRLSPQQIAQQRAQRTPATRIKVPGLAVTVPDACQGAYTEQLEADCGDFILRRSDGVFAYQLAAPADDGALAITEVVRGRDLLASAARQTWLMQTLGYTPPRYCHLPLLLAPDGRRLSKRDGDTDLAALRRQHKTPQVLIGKLAHLCGLLPKAEPVSAQDLVPIFDWSRIHKQDIVIREGYL